MCASAWWELLQADDRLRLQPPAGAAGLDSVERELGVKLPAQLRQLYDVSDGIYDLHGQWFAIWPLGDLVERNALDWIGWETEVRRTLLGFGDDGSGAPYCVAREGGSAIFKWSPIDQESTPIASTLRDFWLSRYPRPSTT
ncbi:SMI1/KNR4 family protein [Kribbella sp. NPDC048928]|uniref:SMI1/KNR4 family protein n=1 Tax=Kribbella sp. NPDC048928 TaxID=3364111 RepID=UPI0037222EE8